MDNGFSLSVLIMLIISAACGMAAYDRAEKLNYTAAQTTLAILAGVLFNIIGLLVVYAVPVTNKGKLATGEMKPCPHCKEPIRSDAILCRYCQSKLD